MGRRGNLAVFESTNISETEEVTSTKIGVHVCYINPYLHDFFEHKLEHKLSFSLYAQIHILTINYKGKDLQIQLYAIILKKTSKKSGL